MNLKQHIMSSVAVLALVPVVGLSAQAAENDQRFEEIVVTATKRSVSVQDIPVSITALDGAELSKKGLVGMDDYLRAVPNVNVQSRDAGTTTLVLRGIAADPENERSTVGVYFGEVPVTGLGSWFGGSPDLKLIDIDRVEILRGPQGTYYGSGSLGGTLRVLPAEPELNEFSANVGAGYSQTARKGDDNSYVQGVLNVPVIEDRLALRTAAYHYDDSGYIDNIAGSNPASIAQAQTLGSVALNEDNIGAVQTTGIRISALLQVTDNLKVTASFITQQEDQNGFNEINPTLGKYEQARFAVAGGGEFVKNRADIYNLVIDYDLEFGSLVSSTSYVDQRYRQERDLSDLAPMPISLSEDSTNETFVEEVRFVSAFEGPFQFLVGGYYQRTDTNLLQQILDSSGTVLPPTNFFDLDADRIVDQYALFGEMSYDLTDKITATVGGRTFKYDEIAQADGIGAFAGPGGIQSYEKADTSDEIFKANLTYQAHDDLLIYGQWSEGFRNGYPHPEVPAAVCDMNNDGLVDGMNAPLPDAVQPDKLESYELGVKWTSEDGRIQAAGAVYRSSWKGIPITQVPDCGFTVTQNAGSARSTGGEIEARMLLGESWQANVGLAVVDPKLTTKDPLVLAAIGAQEGEHLPGVSRFSMNVGVEYNFAVANGDYFIRTNYSYLGGFYSALAADTPKAGDYSLVDLTIGGEIDQTSFQIYAKNLFNEDALTWASRADIGYRLRPRTIGIRVSQGF